MNTPSPHLSAETAVAERWRTDLPLLLAVAAVAVLGRLPALSSWWTLDDWGLLARAAGLDPGAAGLPARWLSRHLWWSLAWPLGGLDPDPQTVARLIIHAVASLLVVRLAARAGLGGGGRWLAGTVYAASPLFFTPLVWAAGIQDLLAVACALAAVERWLAPGRLARLAAMAWVLASLLAKESGLGLPVFMAAVLAANARRRNSADWVVLLFLGLAAVLAASLALGHFAGEAVEPLPMGGPGTVLGNLGACGWWLVSPGPLLATPVPWPMAAAGTVFFLLWAAWSLATWRGGDRVPAAALLACVLALAPVLPLRDQGAPYLAALAAAPLAVALGKLVPRHWSPRSWVLVVLAVAAATWSFGGMRVRLGQRNELGFPADPLVRATSLSWQTAGLLRNLRWPPDTTGRRQLVMLQVPVTPRSRRTAAELGAYRVEETELRRAVGGTRGPRLVLGDTVNVAWSNALTTAPAAAVVLCEAGTGFKVWGPTPNALLYAALTDVGLGAFDRARLHLLRAADLHDETVPFVWDEGLMIVPLKMVIENKESFVDWTVSLLATGHSAQEVGGLQDLFFNLLGGATGRPLDQLTTGSRLLSGTPTAPPDSAAANP